MCKTNVAGVIGAGAMGLNVVNMVVGTGIFVLPGLVAAESTSRKHSVHLPDLSRRSL
jgi:hypothetical protein